MSFSPDFNIYWTRITEDLGFSGNSVSQEPSYSAELCFF